MNDVAEAQVWAAAWNAAQRKCPECGHQFTLKPPFNSEHRCMSCRWKLGFYKDRGVEEQAVEYET